MYEMDKHRNATMCLVEKEIKYSANNSSFAASMPASEGSQMKLLNQEY